MERTEKVELTVLCLVHSETAYLLQNRVKDDWKGYTLPGGKVMLIYNARKQDTAYTKALAALRRKYNTEFHGFSNGLSNEACVAFFDGKCEIYRVDNTPQYDRQGFINRALSSSYSLQETDEKYSEYLNALHAFFDLFSTDGFITVPTDTVAYIGEVL